MKKLQRTITILATAVVPVATPDGIRLLGASLGYSNHTEKLSPNSNNIRCGP